MSQFGRGAKATAAQRAEVERLAAEGVSVRQIAVQVFGDARFRGRVERILRRPASEPVAVALPLEPELEGIDPLELGTNALIRLLFERRLAWLAANGKAPLVRRAAEHVGGAAATASSGGARAAAAEAQGRHDPTVALCGGPR